jgi:hypothetical protein
VLQYILKADGQVQVFDATNPKKRKEDTRLRPYTSGVPQSKFIEIGSRRSSKVEVTFSGNIKRLTG